ncbi:MAG: hypothetical protein ABIJ09_06395 [Pseudomonadota bacterium]
MRSPRPGTHLRRWLRAPSTVRGDEERDPGAWDRWLLRLLDPRRVLLVGDVLVDRRVLRQSFACVSRRCIGADRGDLRSCCADLAVPLSDPERGHLQRHQQLLARHLWRHEPGLRPWLDANPRARELFIEPGGVLARPHGRCVFSRVGSDGAIRCRLRAVARSAGLPRLTLQPLSCALFPLVVVETSPGRLLLSLVTTDNHRLLGQPAPRHFPCLSDPLLPPLVESVRGDLALLFGREFALALAKQA